MTEAPPSSSRTRLEPLGRTAIVATLIHLVLGLGLWWWAQRQGLLEGGADVTWTSPAEFLGKEGFAQREQIPVATQPSPPPVPAAAKPKAMKALAVTPEMLAQLAGKAPTPQPAAPALAQPLQPEPPAPPPEPELPDPPSDVVRTISVSQPLAAQAPTAGLLDMPRMDAAGAPEGVKMDHIDRSIIQAFKACWKPPPGATLDPDKSSVLMDIAISRNGRILSFKLTQPSGHTQLDASVLEAANHLHSIGTKLPPAYGKERYEPRLNFHAE
jgi:hypothetical protein